MQKAEKQHQQTRTQPVEQQGRSGMAAASPQSERIAQLESLAGHSPRAREQAQLASMIDASPRMTAQRRMADMIHNSPHQAAQRKVTDSIHNSPYLSVQRKAPKEGTGESSQTEFAQHEIAPAKLNNTGLPDNLKSGIESLSGVSMDNVRVHYNSSQPVQLNALAYAQGTDIHVAPGQEQHLPHEAWHVVQQAQGRVKPTMQMTGTQINDDVSLEREADVMGARALQMRVKENKLSSATSASSIIQKQVMQLAPPAIDMMSSGDELANSYKRFGIVSGLYKYVLNKGLEYSLNSVRDVKDNLAKSDQGAACKRFMAAGDGEQTAMAKELLAKIYHKQTASEEITSDMRTKLGRGEAISEEDEDTDGPDIEASTVSGKNSAPDIDSKLTSSKACVITGLMFSEGGGVLGARTIEELHFILSTRFKTTWRHYSEDNVYKSLYEHLGYTKSVPESTTKLKNLGTVIGSKTHGMVSVTGHVIGFKKDGTTLYIRDNDENLKDDPSKHSKKNVDINAIWTK